MPGISSAYNQYCKSITIIVTKLLPYKKSANTAFIVLSIIFIMISMGQMDEQSTKHHVGFVI